jgi:hypothetical protein
MKRLLSRRTGTGAAAVALGVAGLAAAPAPAYAAEVSAPYTCTTPLGSQAVSIQASLTATPDPATAGGEIAFELNVSQLGLTAPLTVNSWTATAALDVSGAETAQFPVTGTGGPIPANQPIGGVLHGTWAPSVAGTDEVRGGDVAVTANVVLIGDVSLTCTPDEPRPVGATLTVQ